MVADSFMEYSNGFSVLNWPLESRDLNSTEHFLVMMEIRVLESTNLGEWQDVIQTA